METERPRREKATVDFDITFGRRVMVWSVLGGKCSSRTGNGKVRGFLARSCIM